MSRGIWVLGAGLAVVGTGFVFSVVQTNRLSEQVRDLQRKAGEARVQVAAGEPRPAADGSEAADRLREELNRLRARMDAAEHAAAGTPPATAAGTPAGGVDAETVDRVLKEQKALQQKQKAAKKAAQAAQKPAKRMASRVKTLQLDAAQAESVKPVFEEYDRQYAALGDKRKQTPKTDRAAVEQEIVQLRRSAFEQMRPYLNGDQIAKADYYFNAPRQTSGSNAGERIPQATAASGTAPR